MPLHSFMVDYKKNADYDLHYRNLTHCYEISRIVREEKDTKQAEVIYQSMGAEQKEQAGIEKMLAAAGIHADDHGFPCIVGGKRRWHISRNYEVRGHGTLM